MNNQASWYAELTQPTWAPASWVFGPVWTVLYILIAISFGFVLYQAYKGNVPYLVAVPFVLNLAFNFAFTPLQFGLQNNLLAAIDIVLVLITLSWAMWVIFPYHPWVTYINIPYFLWVGFATVLQLTITYLN